MVGAVVITLALPMQREAQPWVWMPIVAGAATFVVSGLPVVARALERAGGVIVVALISWLIAGTGGVDSPFQDLFVVVLAFDGAVRSRARLATDTIAVGLGVLAPAVYDDAPGWFYGDAFVDMLAWLGVALLVRTLMAQVTSTTGDLAAIVENTDVAVVGADLEGTITSWNPAARELFGHDRDEIVGEHISVLVTERERGEQEHLFELVRDGSSVTVESVRYRRDGTPVDVEMTCSPVRDSVGRIVGCSALYRDIEERLAWQRRVERGERRLRTFGELADGIVYRTRLQPTTEVDYVSPAIETITGFSPDQFYEHPDLPLERSHPEDRERVLRPRQVDAGDEEGAGRVTYRFRRADGQWIWLEDHFRYERDDDGEVLAVQGIVFDVSARAETELARRRALEREQAATERLERTVEMQRTFVQAVSHELRTPLTSITGFARTLEVRYDDLTPEQVRDLLRRLERNAERLSRLLSDLLDVDRLSRGEVEPDLSTVDLGELCLAVAEELDVGDRQLRLGLDGAPTVVADRPKLERIIDNLVRNAARHTPEGTRIDVWFTEAPGGVVLTVEDDGPGVAPDEVDDIFEAFRQGREAAQSPSPGTGVGLSIVSQFAKVHGGEAWYEPRPGGGARFRVRIPRAPNVPSADDRDLADEGDPTDERPRTS